MFEKLVIVGLIILAMAGGYFLGRPNEDIQQQLQGRIEQLLESSESLAQRNQNLEQTLDLVKRQIQTDRIAYQSLKNTVDESEKERQDMLTKFQSQRELLEKLKNKLENQ